MQLFSFTYVYTCVCGCVFVYVSVCENLQLQCMRMPNIRSGLRDLVLGVAAGVGLGLDFALGGHIVCEKQAEGGKEKGEGREGGLAHLSPH